MSFLRHLGCNPLSGWFEFDSICQTNHSGNHYSRSLLIMLLCCLVLQYLLHKIKKRYQKMFRQASCILKKVKAFRNLWKMTFLVVLTNSFPASHKIWERRHNNLFQQSLLLCTYHPYFPRKWYQTPLMISDKVSSEIKTPKSK